MPACTLHQSHSRGTTTIRFRLFAEKGVAPIGAVIPESVVGYAFDDQVRGRVEFGDEPGQNGRCSHSELFIGRSHIAAIVARIPVNLSNDCLDLVGMSGRSFIRINKWLEFFDKTFDFIRPGTTYGIFPTCKQFSKKYFVEVMRYKIIFRGCPKFFVQEQIIEPRQEAMKGAPGEQPIVINIKAIDWLATVVGNCGWVDIVIIES